MQTTNLLHYEVYRDRRMAQLGYRENESNISDTIERLRQNNEQKWREKEDETRKSFVHKVHEKEGELKDRERVVRFRIFLIANFLLHSTKSLDKLFFNRLTDEFIIDLLHYF